MYPEVLKSRLRGTILAYCRSKVRHVEDDMLNISPIINNRNFYPSKENNFGDDSSMVIIYDKHSGDTIISGNIDLSGNIIVESRVLVLSSIRIGIHTGDANHRI